MKIKYNLFLFVIFLSLTVLGVNQNKVSGEVPNHKAIMDFLNDGKACSNRGHVLKGVARAQFLKNIIEWSLNLEERNNISLVNNLYKTSILAKLLYKFGNEFHDEYRRETANQCKQNFANLLAPEDEDLPYNIKIKRYKAYGHIWSAQLSIRVIEGDYSDAWNHLTSAEDWYKTKVAKLWKLHLILKRKHSPLNNLQLDIAHARELYDVLVPPVVNLDRRGPRNAGLNNLAAALHDAEATIVAGEEEPAPLEVQVNPVPAIIGTPIEEAPEEPEEVLIPMIASKPVQPDSMGNSENRKMLEELKVDLLAREREVELGAHNLPEVIAAVDGDIANVDNLEEFFDEPINGQRDEGNIPFEPANIEEDSETEKDSDSDNEQCEQLEVYSQGLASEKFDSITEKEELGCQKKEEVSEDEDLEQCVRKHILALQQPLKGNLNAKLRKELEKRFTIESEALTTLIAKIREELEVTNKLNKFNPKLVNEVRGILMELQKNYIPNGKRGELAEEYKVNINTVKRIIGLLRKQLGTARKINLKECPPTVAAEVGEKVKEMIDQSKISLDKGEKENIKKRYNLTRTEITNVVKKEKAKQNAVEKVTADRKKIEENIYKILKDKRDNGITRFKRGERAALRKKHGLTIDQMDKITAKINKKLDAEMGTKRFSFTEEHREFIYDYLKERREKNRTRSAKNNFYDEFKEKFQFGDTVSKQMIETLVASVNKKLDKEGITHEFSEKHKEFVKSVLYKKQSNSEILSEFNSNFKLEVKYDQMANLIKRLKDSTEEKNTGNKRLKPAAARKTPPAKKSKNS